MSKEHSLYIASQFFICGRTVFIPLMERKKEKGKKKEQIFN
jgi:hypothetical protein